MAVNTMGGLQTPVFPSHLSCSEDSLAATAQPCPSGSKEQKTGEGSLREGSNHAGPRVSGRPTETSFSSRNRLSRQRRPRLPCCAPGRQRAAGSRGPGKPGKGRSASWAPRPGPRPGSATRQDRLAGPAAATSACSGSAAGQRPSPRPTSGVAKGQARHDVARSREAGWGRSQRERGDGSGGWRGRDCAVAAHAQLVSGPKFQHHREMTAFCRKIRR